MEKLIPKKIFEENIKKFDEVESRAVFFKLSENLIKNKFEIESMLLLLSTWNVAYFRYAVSDFNVDNFKKIIKELQPNFMKFDKLNFKNIIFDTHIDDIKTIYNKLSELKGIGYTGASKLMHLKCPNVFVMWDGYIRGEKDERYYKELEVLKDGFFEIKEYPTNVDGYINFLKNMQKKFNHLSVNEQKTLAKSIDEFNFVTITLPIQDKEKKERENKKMKKISI